jgi:hypothetical protein
MTYSEHTMTGIINFYLFVRMFEKSGLFRESGEKFNRK